MFSIRSRTYIICFSVIVDVQPQGVDVDGPVHDASPYIYIYIYIYRERERYTHVFIHIYNTMYNV